MAKKKGEKRAHKRTTANPNDDISPVIRQIADKIVREYQPEKIILFGSHAWGTPGPDSDVDLFIVKDTMTPPLDRMREVRRLLYGIPIAMDTLVYTPTQVERRRMMGDPFVREILERGRTLYAR